MLYRIDLYDATGDLIKTLEADGLDEALILAKKILEKEDKAVTAIVTTVDGRLVKVFDLVSTIME